MPHDAKGNLLQEGDHVMIPCTVRSITTGEEYCNVSVEFLYPMPPNTERMTLSAINTRQLVKVETELNALELGAEVRRSGNAGAD